MSALGQAAKKGIGVAGRIIGNIGSGVGWGIGSSVGQNIVSAAQELKKQGPTLEDEVVVEVRGQPGANKQKLYYIALSTAFGIVRQQQPLNPLTALISPSYGMLMSEDDASDNWVRCTLRYRVGMYGIMATTGINRLFGGGSLFDQLTVYRGPQCNVNGGDFNFIGVAIPGVPVNANGPQAPQLPFKGQPIITPCPTTQTPVPTAVKENPAPDFPISNAGVSIPSPNPKPPGDNRSRGSIPTAGSSTPPSGGSSPSTKGSCCTVSNSLIPLVFAALSAPGTSSDMVFPNPVQGPTGG